MSAISDAVDAIRSIMTTNFPNHVELLNAFFPELNDEINMVNCYGIHVGDGLNTNRLIECKKSVARNFLIVQTRKVNPIGIRTTDAITEKWTKYKQLMEDNYVLVNEIDKHPTLNGDDRFAKCLYESDGGVEFISTEKTNLILIRTIINLEYFEEYT